MTILVRRMIEQQFIEQIEVLEYMQYSSGLVPGFEQAIGFFYHPIHKENEVAILQKGTNIIRKIAQSDSAISSEIETLRQTKFKYEWVNENQIPFERITKKHIQKQVFDELNHYILLMRIDSQQENSKDLLYIYFNPNASNFGLKSIDSNLSTLEKAILSSLLVKSFETIHNQRIRYSERYNILRNDNIRIGDQLKTIQLKHNIDINNGKQKTVKYIEECLNLASKKIHVHLQISSEAQEYIKTYEGGIGSIAKATEQSVMMAYRSQLTPEGGILRVEAFHLRTYFDKEELVSVSVGIESIADSRYHNTIQYLNRLEEAAKKVQANGNILTGSAVGQAMEKPISAPAISDALKKNKNKIKSLVADFPNEWITIRKSFKPIRNVIGA